VPQSPPSEQPAAGTLVVCASGYSAFVPHSLPPPLAWSERLVAALSDADRLIGQLAGEGGRLPNPHLLMRPFIVREAVLSSRIEGTRATLGEILAAEAADAMERSSADLREVANYVVALEYGMQRLAELPLSLRLVRELHEKLMSGVRGNYATPGEFRRSQNWIGAPGSTLSTATFVPAPPDRLMECLGAWETFLHERQLPPLVQAALMHWQFEAIHPFLDGNGRVGRLLITLFLHVRKVLPAPLLYLSAFFEATRRDYYEGLRGVSERGDWERWLIYFLNGVARQSEDALSRAQRINAQMDQWRARSAAGTTASARALLERLAANPFVTARKAATVLGIGFTTAQRAIARLVEQGVVKQVGEQRRDRVFCAQALLDILDEPPRLVPMEAER
jgi:Fic family protein